MHGIAEGGEVSGARPKAGSQGGKEGEMIHDNGVLWKNRKISWLIKRDKILMDNIRDQRDDFKQNALTKARQGT